MGYAVRTERHRYIEWRDWKSGRVEARELYDHHVDSGEMRNLAGDPERGGELEMLRGVLEKGWRGALPE